MAKTKYVDLAGLQVFKSCTEEKISDGDAGAKSYADGLHTTMGTRVDSLEAKIGDGFEVVTAEEISGLFTE